MSGRVFIQRVNGQIASESSFAAWTGFSKKGREATFYEWPELKAGGLDLSPDAPLVGGMLAVHTALGRLGVTPPAPLNLPEPLAAYRGRDVWATTLGDVRGRVREGHGPVFVKPLSTSKVFTGHVVRTEDDLAPTAHLDDWLEVQAQGCVAFVAEWRYFVLRGAVVGLAHYTGDLFLTPAADVVWAAVGDYGPAAPAAYALDFGVTDDGRTLLVEANDGYALGCYGLPSVTYADMLEARWRELTGGAVRRDEG